MLSYAGPLTFSLHARKTTLKLTAKSPEEADEWIGELQDVSALLSVYVYTDTVILVLCIHHMCIISLHIYIQAIDNCPPIQTVTERLVLEMIKVSPVFSDFLKSVMCLYLPYQLECPPA